MNLAGNYLAGWDFQDQLMDFSNFQDSDLTESDLRGAILTSANLEDAILVNAEVEGASLANTTSIGFAKEQLYSTASYQRKNLAGVNLGVNDLSAWDFSGLDLTGASFNFSTMNGVNL